MSAKISKITTQDMEMAVAHWAGTRNHIVVPNVSWGMGLHECDMLIVWPSGTAAEVEIKVSISDLRADAKKPHGHRSKRIKWLYFAIPHALLTKALALIPDDAGILTLRDGCAVAHVERKPKKRGAEKFSETEVRRIAELGVMRYWDLKRAYIANLKAVHCDDTKDQTIKYLRESNATLNAEVTRERRARMEANRRYWDALDATEEPNAK